MIFKYLPETIKKLQGFHDMMNIYRKCIKRAARLLTLRKEQLAESGVKDIQAVNWTPQLEEAFTKC